MPNKLQVSFRKRATNFRALLQKTISKGKASYDSTPPCIHVYIYMNMCDPSDSYVTWLIQFTCDITHLLLAWHHKWIGWVMSVASPMRCISHVTYEMYESCHTLVTWLIFCVHDMTRTFHTWHDWYNAYGVAWISSLLKIIGLFCRISSLFQGSFTKETYDF